MKDIQDVFSIIKAYGKNHMLRFILESNAIEGICREPTHEEISEYQRFMDLDEVTIDDLIQFVSVYEQDARLRDQMGLDVRVGNYTPQRGGPDIRDKLSKLLDKINGESITPYKAHCLYETIHPFTDCNGRSGRMLWMWMMKESPLGFLHTWYYQSLEESRK